MQAKTSNLHNGNRRPAQQRETSMLLAVSQAIATVRDKQDLLRLVFEHIKPVFGFHDCGLFVLDADGGHHSDWTVLLPEIDPSAGNVALRTAGLGRHPHPGSVIAAHMQQAAAGPFILDFEQEQRRHPDYPFFRIALAEGYRGAMAGLLQVGGRPVGMFYVNSQQTNFFQPAQLPLFQAVADQVAVAVANILANEEIAAREREKTQLLRISEALAEARTRRELLQVTFDQVQAVLPFADAGLFEVRPDGTNRDFTVEELLQGLPLTNVLHQAGVHGFLPPHAAVDYFLHEPRIQSLAWLQANMPGHPHYPYLQKTGLLEILGGPLLHNGRVIGMLCFWARETGAFHPRQFPLFKQLASLVATTVANVLAREEILAREREKATLLRISSALVTIRDRRQLFRVIYDDIRPIFPYDSAGLFVVDEPAQTHSEITDDYILDSDDERLLEAEVGRGPFAHPGSVVEYIMQQPGPRLYDLEALAQTHSHPQLPLMLETGYRQLIAGPLVTGGRTFGMVCFNAKVADRYSAQDLPLFQAITEQLAVVVSNILAHEEIVAREAEKSALLSISEAIATVRNQEDLLGIILTRIKPLLPFYDCGILVVDKPGQRYLDLATIHPTVDDSEVNHHLHQAGIYDAGGLPYPGSAVEWLVQQMTAAPGPVLFDYRADNTHFSDAALLETLRQLGYCEGLAGLLQTGGQAFGCFVVNARQPGQFQPVQYRLFQSITEQLSVAVANILANAELQEREREKTVLLSISEALATIRDKNQLLQTVFEKVRPLLRFHDTGLFVLDKSQQFIEDWAVTLPDVSPSEANVKLRAADAGRIPYPGSAMEYAVGQLRAAPGPRVFAYTEELIAQFPDYPQFVVLREVGYKESVGALLRTDQGELGILFFNSVTENHFTPAQFHLVQTIADQVAVAVANILANEELRAREQEKALLLAVSEAIATVRGKEELFRIFNEQLRPVLGYDYASVLVIDHLARAYRHFLIIADEPLEHNPLYQEAQRPRPFNDFIEKALASEVPLTYRPAELIEQFPQGPGLRLQVQLGIEQSVVFSLQHAGQVIGLFILHNTQDKNLGTTFHPLFRNLANQVAVAVANILANEEIVTREQEKTVLLAISNVIATINNKAQLLRLLFEQVRPLFDFDDAGLAVLGSDGRHYNDWVAQYADVLSPDIAAKQTADHRFAWGGSLLEHAAREVTAAGHPLVYSLTPALAEQWSEATYLSTELADEQQEVLATTLRAGGQLLGLFNINSKRKGHLSTINHFIFQAVADQVAVAVANILANEELRAREQEKTMQLAVNNALVSSKNRESLCRTLAEQMNQLVPFSLFVLCIWSPADETRFQATLRRQPDGQFVSIQREVQQLFPPALSPPQRRALFESPGVFAGAAFEDLCRQYPLYAFVREQFGVHSHLRLSLSELAGAEASIVVSGPGPEDFQEVDYATLQHLLPQITLALDNLLAFERLDQQRREKASQVATTNALTSDQPFNELVRSLAAPIDSLVPCDLVHLCLLPPHAAGVEADVAVVKEGGRFQPLPRAEVLRHLPAETLAAGFEELRALATQTRLYVGDEVPPVLGASGLLHYLHQAQAMRAFLLVPLRVNGLVAAGLLLAHRFAYGFAAADVAKIEALAAQMALALGNRFAFAEIATLQQQLAEENSYLQDEIKTTHNFEEIIGTSPAILAVFQQVSQVAATDTTVCIGGETGTGKELIARALHNLSPRKNRLLVKVNCAALPAQLIESELFGHEKGAFTGAHERRIGKFELADGGSIFLDEIGELPLELQAKLLRVLQEREVERVGGKGPIRTDVRIIAATNRDLQQEVQAGRFRQDLYYRLLVFPLLLPPLRERREDIPALATHFLFQFAKKMGKPHKGIAPKAMHELMAYDWPGNIRELQHTLEQAVIVSTKPLLELARPLAAAPAPVSEADRPAVFRQLSLDEMERQHILATLRYTGGRIRGSGGAAELLAIKATTLEARMKKLGVSKSYLHQAIV
ncbi:sigma 54-interacting transcriptional regulator [Hymenobacter arizonensis]|uniref:Transcriptional regulator containing GAF, AAA-type ATPase, and DNA-binding Fis domains n=1 Tax=Hymenobacter arizonensis TaxID=1227077 RepID=A0A1I6BJQ0_HYMAR|nr:sigma 54-interacting transcriptional regulator [Hymenobacter arizonensis]SFQ81155.1 Transcriptional regulator containing GAF, AAA-type ATPase, and DNA-binding Fis domains [Hymenobacter arizonensis]